VSKLRHFYVLNVFSHCFCEAYWCIIYLNKVSFDMQKLRSCRRNGGIIKLFTFVFYEKYGLLERAHLFEEI